VLSVDTDDPEAVERASEQAQALVRDADLPAGVRAEIEATYGDLGGAVAVRSSATAEDRPEASFAGQQETYLNVAGADAVSRRVQDCWASLFTPRAISYRARQEFTHEEGIAVVVQELVDAEKSGVVFTADPTTGAPEVTVEATWGLGEAVVAGEVSPDSYRLDRETGDLLASSVPTKERMHVRGTEETVVDPVPEEKRDAQVLTDEELAELVALAREVEAEYGTPQDVEWAIADGDLLVVQSRPLTTIEDGDGPDATTTAATGALTGLGASPGVAEGEVCFDPIEAVKRARDGDSVVLVREMTSPADQHGMEAADGILTSRGGRTCHAAIVARELGTPAVVGCEGLVVDTEGGRLLADERTLGTGDRIRIDGDAGTVTVLD
jgi:pyruvate,water dikinase